MSVRLKIADVDYGDLEGFGKFTVSATTARGERFLLAGHAFTEAEAIEMYWRVKKAGTINPEFWVEWYPVYGSEASQDEYEEAGMYGMSLSAGHISEWDVPENLMALL